jgi:mannose/fructose/N-acetylgalactosamine-specific phosphotransferase system component IID
MGYFNSTPALAPCLAAAVARLEEDGAEESEVARLKESAAGPLAAAGDQLFWATLRPLSALAGLVGSALGPGFAVVFALSFYSIPQGFFRSFSVTRGYGLGGEGVAACIGAANRFTAVGRTMASSLVGLLAGALMLGFGDRYGAGGELITIGAVAGMGWLLMSRRVAPERICVALLALSGLLSLLLGG